MLTHIRCLALHSVRITDSKTLLSVWTEKGRLTLLMPAGKSREAQRRRALTIPLTTFEGVCDIRPDKEIISIRDVSPCLNALAITATPRHHAQAAFLAEVLDSVLRHTEPDETLNKFIFYAAEVFAATPADDLANFAISFFAHLTRFLGIEPDTANIKRASFFDLREGHCCAAAPLHNDWIDKKATRTMRALLAIPLTQISRMHFNQYERNATLDYILKYFSIHFTPIREPRTLSLFKNLYD